MTLIIPALPFFVYIYLFIKLLTLFIQTLITLAPSISSISINITLSLKSISKHFSSSNSVVNFFEKLWLSFSDLLRVGNPRHWVFESLNFLYDRICLHPFRLIKSDRNSPILLFSQQFSHFPPGSDWLA